ncbi:hypothetical protein N9018_04750 [Rhodopirellula sp.]|nr:hypothetical protein [Rubripirellula sp.]MDB4477499.1 hypothetical protein [Rhodopirellula sp.]MDB4624769.1 hypothetical protein [Rubripirellula sp.]
MIAATGSFLPDAYDGDNAPITPSKLIETTATARLAANVGLDNLRAFGDLV